MAGEVQKSHAARNQETGVVGEVLKVAFARGALRDNSRVLAALDEARIGDAGGGDGHAQGLEVVQRAADWFFRSGDGRHEKIAAISE